MWICETRAFYAGFAIKTVTADLSAFFTHYKCRVSNRILLIDITRTFGAAFGVVEAPSGKIESVFHQELMS